MSAPRSTPRVLVVPSSYLAGTRTVGGGERYALEYARTLARLTPTTLALFDPRPTRELEGELEVRTFAMRRGSEGRIFPLTRAARRELAGYDVIHLMIFPTPLSDLLILLARLRRQTVVLTDVGGGSPTFSTYLQKLHPRLSLSRLAHGLAPLSQHSAGQFAGWRQPSRLLFGGACLPERWSGEGEYALFVGRLLPHKGVLELIEAIGEDTPLHVVGRPYDPDYLERLRKAAAGKRVTFVLDADDHALEAQYAGARVVLQPSIPVQPGAADTSELLGLVALEGMAHGKPVVVTRAGSLPELVREGETGFVVEPGNRAELRARLESLMRDPELCGRLGAAARRHVEENFTWEQVAARGLDLYDELRGGKERSRSSNLEGIAA